jgi:hypothetical protein
LSQQPDVDGVPPNAGDVPVAPVTSVMLPQGVPGIEIVELPAREFVAEESALGAGSATMGLVTASNVVVVGSPIIGLTPKLLISAEPSGIPTRVDDDPVAVDGIAGAPEDDMLEVVESQLPNTAESVGSAGEIPFVDVVPFTPPPSKLEKVDVSPAAADADVGTSEQPAPPVELNVVGELDIGELKPPGLSSTEPKGIPVGAVAVRGDVVPIAGGVTVLTCARLGPLGNSADTVAAINKPATLSLRSFRIGFHRRFWSLAMAPEELERPGFRSADVARGCQRRRRRAFAKASGFACSHDVAKHPPGCAWDAFEAVLNGSATFGSARQAAPLTPKEWTLDYSRSQALESGLHSFCEVRIRKHAVGHGQ